MARRQYRRQYNCTTRCCQRRKRPNEIGSKETLARLPFHGEPAQQYDAGINKIKALAPLVLLQKFRIYLISASLKQRQFSRSLMNIFSTVIKRLSPLIFYSLHFRCTNFVSKRYFSHRRLRKQKSTENRFLGHKHGEKKNRSSHSKYSSKNGR